MADAASVPPETGKDDTQRRLEKLRRELYAREESPNLKARGEDLRTIGIRRSTLPVDGAAGRAPATTFVSLSQHRAKRRRKLLLIGGGVALLTILFGTAVGGTIWYRLRHNIKPEQIHLALTAPEQFTAGDDITYRLSFRNDSYLDWENVEIIFDLPRGFRLVSASRDLKTVGKQYVAAIGTVAEGEAGTIELTGPLLGEANASLIASAEIVFTPANFPSGRFTQKSLATTIISIVPVEVAIDAIDDVESGERLVVTMKVTNQSSKALAGAYLKINPAPGIQLAPEDTQFSPDFSLVDATWSLGTIEPAQSTERRVVAYVEGQPGERRTIDVEAGVRLDEQNYIQRALTHVFTVVASALSIEQIYNDTTEPLTVAPADSVQGTIRYANVGNVGLGSVVVKVKLEGNGFDPASLKLPAGAYDPTTRTITWTAASVPALATLQPAQSGELAYEFSILPATSFPTSGENVKNNVIVASATIDSPDLTSEGNQPRQSVSDRAVMSVSSPLTLQADAFYDDGRLGLTSTGPLPPAAGQQTTYTVRIRLGSLLNDVGDVRVEVILPDGVRYTDQHYKTTGDVSFNTASGLLTWTIPRLDGLTGRTKPPEELHVQVAITPAEHQVGSTITFLNKLQATATDLFTDTLVRAEVTAFPTTETADRNKGKVVE